MTKNLSLNERLIRLRGEDWLEEQLDRDGLDPQLREMYGRELDRRAGTMSRQQAELTAKREAAARRVAEIRQLLIDGDGDVVDLYGLEEFGQDYGTDLDGSGVWHVTSTVARADQANSWSFELEVDARRQLRSLIYDRMYYKYVRLGRVDGLQELPDFVSGSSGL